MLCVFSSLGITNYYSNLSTNKSVRIPQRCIPQVPSLWKWRKGAMSGHVIFQFSKNLHVDRVDSQDSKMYISAKRTSLCRVPFCKITSGIQVNNNTPYCFRIMVLWKCLARVRMLSRSSRGKTKEADVEAGYRISSTVPRSYVERVHI